MLFLDLIICNSLLHNFLLCGEFFEIDESFLIFNSQKKVIKNLINVL